MKKFKWTDELALEFARVSQAGAYGNYKGLHSITSKLQRFKQIKMQKERETNCWIIVDEETLKVVTNEKHPEVALKFQTAEAANQYASERLGLWSVFHIHFMHPWIQHHPNTFPETSN